MGSTVLRHMLNKGMFGYLDALNLAQKSYQARLGQALEMQVWVVWLPGCGQPTSVALFGWLHWRCRMHGLKVEKNC